MLVQHVTLPALRPGGAGAWLAGRGCQHVHIFRTQGAALSCPDCTVVVVWLLVLAFGLLSLLAACSCEPDPPLYPPPLLPPLPLLCLCSPCRWACG